MTFDPLSVIANDNKLKKMILLYYSIIGSVICKLSFICNYFFFTRPTIITITYWTITVHFKKGKFLISSRDYIIGCYYVISFYMASNGKLLRMAPLMVNITANGTEMRSELVCVRHVEGDTSASCVDSRPHTHTHSTDL